MKTAILADIHGNLEALSRCHEHAVAVGAGSYVCLGDCVGYGADPAATLRLIMSLPGLLAVRGNPAFLEGLPYLQSKGRATYVHSSAAAPARWEYLRMPEQLEACMQAAPTPVTFVGHVHVPKVFYRTPGGDVRELDPPSGVPIPLSPGSRYVISVGSVGQPRDGNNAACYVMYDDEAEEIVFYRLPYDYVEAGRKILAARLDPYFAERLAHGR